MLPARALPSPRMRWRNRRRVRRRASGRSHYNGYRDFDPATGRYVESDPIGLAGGVNTYVYVENSPLYSSDPEGLWSAAAHHDIYQNAFPGLDPGYLADINSGSDWVDYLDQFNFGSYVHAMRAPGQSIADAKAKACEFIRGNMDYFNQFKDSTHFKHQAYRALGRALHTITDSTSPAHEGWQEWDLYSSEWEWHGDAAPSLESIQQLTPDRLLKSVNLIRQALNGNACSCAATK